MQVQQQNNHNKASSTYSFCSCIEFKLREDHFQKHFARFPFKLLFALKLQGFRIFALNASSFENRNWVFVLLGLLGFESCWVSVLPFWLIFKID